MGEEASGNEEQRGEGLQGPPHRSQGALKQRQGLWFLLMLK